MQQQIPNYIKSSAIQILRFTFFCIRSPKNPRCLIANKRNALQKFIAFKVSRRRIKNQSVVYCWLNFRNKPNYSAHKAKNHTNAFRPFISRENGRRVFSVVNKKDADYYSPVFAHSQKKRPYLCLRLLPKKRDNPFSANKSGRYLCRTRACRSQ